jgi:hypothetical protein
MNIAVWALIAFVFLFVVRGDINLFERVCFYPSSADWASEHGWHRFPPLKGNLQFKNYKEKTIVRNIEKIRPHTSFGATEKGFGKD